MFINRILVGLAYYAGLATQEPITPVIKELDQINYYQAQDNTLLVHANRQNDSFSCGYWSLFHAYAIQKCIDNNEPISNEKIIKYAQEHKHLIDERNELFETYKRKKLQEINEIKQRLDIDQKQKDEQIDEINRDLTKKERKKLLETDEIYQANNKYIKFNNIYGIGDYDGTIWIHDYLNKVTEKLDESSLDFEENLNPYRDENRDKTVYSDEQKKALQDQYYTECENIPIQILSEQSDGLNIINEELLNTNKIKAIHFICNLDGEHWILISIIKIPNKTPILLLIDSTNPNSIPISANKYIDFLSQYLINNSENNSINKSLDISITATKKPAKSVQKPKQDNNIIASKLLGLCQKEETSGYCALFNAYASQECINNNEDINAENLHKYALEFESLITKTEMLSSKEIQNIKEQYINSANIAILEYYKDIESYWLYDLYKQYSERINHLYDSTKQDNKSHKEIKNRLSLINCKYKLINSIKLNDIKENFTKNSNKISSYHFICNIDNQHWVNINLIKKPNETLSILIIESLNPQTEDEKSHYNSKILPIIKNYVQFLIQYFST